MAFQFEEHTGEVALRVEAPQLGELFSKAARGLVDLMGTPDPDLAGPWESITVDASDPESLLVDWLNELIARTDIHNRLYLDVLIEEISEQRLRARVRGHDIAEPHTAVKAATLHGLEIER